jgi:hypothetical protein
MCGLCPYCITAVLNAIDDEGASPFDENVNETIGDRLAHRQEASLRYPALVKEMLDGVRAK